MVRRYRKRTEPWPKNVISSPPLPRSRSTVFLVNKATFEVSAIQSRQHLPTITITITMGNPLFPANPNTLNVATGSPSLMQFETPSKFPVKTMANNVPSNANEDEIDWDEGPSSPFVTELPEDQENLSGMAAVRPSSAMTEDIDVLRFDDEEITASIAANIPIPETPFSIAEDETSTSRTFKTVSSSIKLSPSKVHYSRCSSYSSHEEITSKTRYANENQSLVAESRSTSLPVDDSVLDDTCFSMFSQVPDMTSFAKLGQTSPTRQFMFDQVGLAAALCLSDTDVNRKPLDRDRAIHLELREHK